MQWCSHSAATVLVAFTAYFYMYDYPQTAKFLTERERAIVLDMLAEDDHLATHFDKKFIFQAVSDYKTWIQVGIFIGYALPISDHSLILTRHHSCLIPVYDISQFLPTIV